MKASGRRILFTLAATVHVGRGALEPCHAPENDALQYNATYQAAICANQTLFTPATTKLPEGTYIALGLKGARELADYLDVHPDVKITNLLISDSTVGDLAIDFGYQDTYIDFFNDLHTRLDRETQLEYNAINRNVSRDLQQTILDLDALSSRIMNKVAPSLETFAYLNYITTWGEYWRLEIPDDNRTRNVLDRDFPRLTHLTLRDRRWRFQTLEGRSTFFPPLPALTHLHILTGNHVPALSVIRQAVPNATHVLFTANYPAEFSAKPMFLVRWTQSLMRILVGSVKSPTIIVQPDHNPMLRRGQECGNPGVEYHYELRRLAHNRELHLRLPPEEDFDQYGITYEGYTVFPLIRAIAEFEDRLGGGEGEWGIPSKNETVKYEL
ncbi:hypothetical protein C8F04DRAFT_1067215 [Mycena alexandri]|uniref:Uncharacterized protein n=1 Tax=Mycena alexandri TaxID=1745969 RepID=A0AAD6TGV5_9AGAR|nr:hypothetical protein C8F04DRAFT_1067215 [Mycena alexandri]